MRQFIRRALQKLNKLTADQVRELLVSAAGEIDRLEAVLDSFIDGVLICGADNGLVMANRSARRYLPIALDEQPSAPIWNLVRDEPIAQFLRQVLESGDKATDREFFIDKVHSEQAGRLLSVSVLPLVRDRRVSGSLIRIEDITEKRMRESQIRRMESLASLTTLAAGVAHEIKNPLGSISIHVQLIQKAFSLRRDELPSSLLGMVENYLDIVNEEIDRLNHIVVDFLFAARPIDIELCEGDINAFLKELLDFVYFELEEHSIECALDLQENLPPVLFDGRLMKQALLNLVKNAIAAMEDGGVLTIQTALKDRRVAITVSDTGKGIPPDILSKIFEPFFTTKSTGSGLGLTLVYKIVHEHNGELAVKSTEEEGAHFTILLPAARKDLRSLPGPETARTPEKYRNSEGDTL